MYEIARRYPNVLRLIAMLAISAGMLWAAWKIVDIAVPSQDNPFKPLDLSLQPGVATGMKLDRLKQKPDQCLAALDAAGVAYTHIIREDEERNCRIDNALTLDRSLTPYSATLSMSCRTAAALYMWERHVVLPAAEKNLGSAITRIDTFGSYSCRRVNHAKEGRWSNHATGDAVDISGFRLEDGRRITIKGDYADDTAEGRFLRDVRDGACKLFSATLGPDYNALHADHLHLDMGAYTICS